MCFRRLIVEGDSLTVIKNIQKKEEDKSVIRQITHHIYNLGMYFDAVSYLVVPRVANEAAHTLATEGWKRKVYGSWEHGVPDSVKMAALKDRSAWFQRS
ncbi:hypothetical protein Gogos_021326 [Gossypium gossypioides]|uniref:RNase H type-1 domain-containing protein n=1 Tax=Gossypium gossypioides TaxID=34282 RepID=A0A7J9CZW8_GOSGO|nr:hypothetical protein [Gossypium gossypioides]